MAQYITELKIRKTGLRQKAFTMKSKKQKQNSNQKKKKEIETHYKENTRSCTLDYFFYNEKNLYC